MNKPTTPTIQATECCALRQLCANNYSTLRNLRECVNNIKVDGYRAVFVITLVAEKKLVANLKRLKFKPITKFHRRKAYDNTLLTMWIKSW